MTQPTDQELRELDAWIAEYLFGYYLGDLCDTTGVHWFGPSHTVKEPPCYTTDPAAAFEVLKRCADKCAISIARRGEVWVIQTATGVRTEAPTPELAISRFSKKVFGGAK